jgi:hypothetical protein
MFEAEFSLEALHLCLADLPPVELKGMVLLRERRPLGQFFPTGFAREVVADAVTEIVGYTQRCQRAVQQLSELTAIPLTAFAIMEYGL